MAKQTKKNIDKRIEGLREALLEYGLQQKQEPDEKLVKANINLLREKEDLEKDIEILNKENIKNRRELSDAEKEIETLREKLKDYDLMREKLIKTENKLAGYEESISKLKHLLPGE